MEDEDDENFDGDVQIKQKKRKIVNKERQLSDRDDNIEVDNEEGLNNFEKLV